MTHASVLSPKQIPIIFIVQPPCPNLTYFGNNHIINDTLANTLKIIPFIQYRQFLVGGRLLGVMSHE